MKGDLFQMFGLYHLTVLSASIILKLVYCSLTPLWFSWGPTLATCTWFYTQQFLDLLVVKGYLFQMFGLIQLTVRSVPITLKLVYCPLTPLWYSWGPTLATHSFQSLLGNRIFFFSSSLVTKGPKPQMFAITNSGFDMWNIRQGVISKKNCETHSFVG